ncbi:MAG: hypothetical protein ACRCX2_22040 [Paraclostridium sp.]
MLFSTRERANTIQRLGRISRSFKGKTDAIVFDYIYDHYYSYYQFQNNAGECRMKVHQEFTHINPTQELFMKYMKNRFNPQQRFSERDYNEFEKIKGRYILQIS